MKYLKRFNEELKRNLTDDLKYLFMDISDNREFIVSFYIEKASKLDKYFPKAGKTKNMLDYSILRLDGPPKALFDCYLVNITKWVHKVNTEFHMKEIIETLKFAESYAKAELKLKIEYILVASRKNTYANDNIFYKSINDIPSDKKFLCIEIYFSEI